MVMYKSVVSRAHAKSQSLRTTIPIKICRQLKLAPGDVLDWEIEEGQDKKSITVRKLE